MNLIENELSAKNKQNIRETDLCVGFALVSQINVITAYSHIVILASFSVTTVR